MENIDYNNEYITYWNNITANANPNVNTTMIPTTNLSSLFQTLNHNTTYINENDTEYENLPPLVSLNNEIQQSLLFPNQLLSGNVTAMGLYMNNMYPVGFVSNLPYYNITTSATPNMNIMGGPTGHGFNQNLNLNIMGASGHGFNQNLNLNTMGPSGHGFNQASNINVMGASGHYQSETNINNLHYIQKLAYKEDNFYFTSYYVDNNLMNGRYYELRYYGTNIVCLLKINKNTSNPYANKKFKEIVNLLKHIVRIEEDTNIITKAQFIMSKDFYINKSINSEIVITI
jgi:hypothetical protein